MTPETLVAAGRAAVRPFLPDTCSVKSVVEGAKDGFGGEAVTHPTVASGISCLYEPENPSGLMITGGAVSGATRHKIFLLMDDVDLQAIGPFYEITVEPRGDKGALIFQNCRRLDESNEVLLTVSAVLKQ